MNLKNFEEFIRLKIVDRGLDYYEDGQIVEVEQFEKGVFNAVVWGSERYSVTVKLDVHLNITDHSCSCPYDWDDCCKHLVAVLFHLRDHKDYEKAPGTSGKLGLIKKELKTYSKAELKELVMKLAMGSPDMRDEILWSMGFEFEDDF